MIAALRGLDTGAVDPLFQPLSARKSLAVHEARIRSHATELYAAIQKVNRKMELTIPATEIERRIARAVGVTPEILRRWLQNHPRRKRQRPL
jgi:hypothetical protein